AVVLPALLVFWLTYRNAAALASKSEGASLRVANKHFALSVFDRLMMARVVLERGDSLEANNFRGAPFFSDVRDLSTAQLQPLIRLGSMTNGGLVILGQDGEPPRVALVRITKRPLGTTFRVGTIDSNFLWGDSDGPILGGQVCVLSGDVQLMCVGSNPTIADERLVHDKWELFIAPEFGSTSWRFQAKRPKQLYFGEYAGLIAPVGLGMLLLALLLSSIEIRRILVPLEDLVGRLKRVGGGGAALSVEDRDEFGTLDHAFTEMESRISDQILMLRTLREIDQLILLREPLIKVVDVVLRHIQSISASSALAMSLRTSTGSQAVRHFVRLHIGDDTTSRQGADPMADRGASLATPSPVWQCSNAIGPGFSEVELAGVAFLTIGAEEGPFIRVAIGQQESASALLDRMSLSSESVAELAERVAVAASAEAHETRLIFQARHDLLTSLPNRLAVLEALPSYIKHADAFSQSFATLFIDLDRFKAINDGVGHQLADVVLVEVSRRIRAAVGPEPLVARLGGDEFLIVVPKAGDAKGAFAVDQSVRQALISPIVVGDQQFKVDFSAGIAIYPDDGSDPESLMHNADLAMYRAKRGGGARTAAFESEMNSSATKYAQMEKDLRSAIHNSELFLHYQPRVDSRTGSIVGAEALARWEHPRLGAIMPDEFIALAEECGLISEIGALAIDQACGQLAQWKQSDLILPRLAVNVSS
ncbi:MAG: diguanylate cyclase, partial [Alphaproteobacteria bacterium]